MISELSNGLQCHQCRTGDPSRLHQLDEGGDPRLLHQCHDCLAAGAECDNLRGPAEDIAADDPYWSLWHDASIAELRVVCGLCGRDICYFSAYIGGRSAWEIALGRDLNGPEIRTGRSFASDIDAGKHMGYDRRWTLICPGRKCSFRKVVTVDRVREAMVKTWYSGSHRLVAGVDI